MSDEKLTVGQITFSPWPSDPVERALMESDQRRSFVAGQIPFDQPDREVPRDVLADEVRRLREELLKSERQRAALNEALLFYADPETYFAIGFFPDPPCGAFMSDFEDIDDTIDRPGKRARAALKGDGESAVQALMDAATLFMAMYDTPEEDIVPETAHAALVAIDAMRDAIARIRCWEKP